MKKSYRIRIVDHEFFFLDEILAKVQSRYQRSEEFDQNKKTGGTNNEYRKGRGRVEGSDNVRKGSL